MTPNLPHFCIYLPWAAKGKVIAESRDHLTVSIQGTTLRVFKHSPSVVLLYNRILPSKGGLDKKRSPKGSTI